MEYIKITSQGEIDERAFSLVGATSKRSDDTKIGMFGSGLKYSLAYLLNNQIKFTVFSGYREIQFTTVDENFRGVNIKRIYVNGEKTSLSTDMGMDWTHWYVLREIYCNALDESDADISVVNLKSCIVPTEDYTTFYIQIDAQFKEILTNWNYYFSNRRKDLLWHDFESNQIYVGGSDTLIYRKGIRCLFNDKIPSLFHYDLSFVKINESRVIANDWEFKYQLVKFLKKIDDDSIVHRIVYAINEYSEKSLYWESSESFSEAYLRVIGDKYVIPYENAGFWKEEIDALKNNCIILPNDMIKGLKISFGDNIRIIGDTDNIKSKGDIKVINELTKRQSHLLSQALEFLENSEYDVKYEIQVVKFTRDEVLGQAKDGKILISEKVLSMGRREIVSTIIEENEHLKSGCSDETRAFQNHLINLLIVSYEDKTGTYL